MSKKVECPAQPSWLWRKASTSVMGFTGFLARAFLMGLSKPEVHGLEGFLDILEERRDVKGRNRGLVTVSNHVSVVDDPLIWGALPFRFLADVDNMRWSLGSHDICYKNKFSSAYFTLGQVLPTHRKMHSAFGGLFQPTITECIRLLSKGPFHTSHSIPKTPEDRFLASSISDPFSDNQLTFSTNGTDHFHAPSMFLNRRYSWVHIFPEGKVHQHPAKTMRYFKWGVSRLLLEAEPMPRLVPIWVDGPQNVMHEERTFPRFIPRAGKEIKIFFGDEVDVEKVFGDLRRKWQKLVKSNQKELLSSPDNLGIITSQTLMTGREAVELRKECTRRVRHEVLKVRRKMNLPDEDPKEGLEETWREEGIGKEKGKMKDGSWVGET